MEPKFQTSFIPKKPTVGMPVSGSISNKQLQKTKSPVASVFMAISVIVFVLSVGAVGGAYFWRSYLQSANQGYKNELASKEKTFNVDLIEKLKRIDLQVDSARNVLNNHVALSGIFDVIKNMTVEDVRFVSMDLKNPGNGGPLSLSLQGMGKNMPTVAFQSDILGQLSDYNLAGIVRSAAVSSPTIGETGSVSFGLTAELDASKFLYSQLIDSANDSQ